MSQQGGTRGDGATAPAGLWDRPHVRYLVIAYAWSWVLWLAAFALSKAWDTDVLYNQDFVWRVAFERDVPGQQLLVSLVSMGAVYGPLIGGLIMSRRDPAIPAGSLAQRAGRVAVGGRMYGLVLGILLLVTLPPLIVSAVAVEPSPDAPSWGLLLPFLLAFFLVQMLTSGTEEFGWRGYLTEKMLPGRNFWDTGWAVGLVWAVWHLPVTVMIFLEQGLAPAAIVGSLVGFGIGIVAMSILHTWFYERTRSVFLAVFIHAIFNTVPLTIVLLFEGSPAAVMSNLLLWAVVIYLKSRWDKENPIPRPLST